jgi:hypothetical protein
VEEIGVGLELGVDVVRRLIDAPVRRSRVEPNATPSFVATGMSPVRSKKCNMPIPVFRQEVGTIITSSVMALKAREPVDLIGSVPQGLRRLFPRRTSRSHRSPIFKPPSLATMSTGLFNAR